MTLDPYGADRLADRARIQDALHAYCRAIDRLSLDDMKQVFHDDATTDNGHYKGDIPGFVAQAAARHAGLPQTFHMVGNIAIDFLGPDSAFVETYCLALERHPESDSGPIDRVVRVRYADTFERRGGHWKIAERIIVFDHEMAVPLAVGGAPVFGAGGFRGRRDADDPVLVRRRSLGVAPSPDRGAA
jgi:hypothetical protein